MTTKVLGEGGLPVQRVQLTWHTSLTPIHAISPYTVLQSEQGRPMSQVRCSVWDHEKLKVRERPLDETSPKYQADGRRQAMREVLTFADTIF